MDVSILTEAEVHAMGLSSIVHNGQVADPDNPIAASMLDGGSMPQQDADGRQIVSFAQFEELGRRGARMDNYAIRMRWPGRQGVWPIPASKFLKWYGLGYRPVGEVTEEAKKKAAQRAEGIVEDRTADNDITIFRCNSKYPECERFFDNSRGLKAHWGKDHGEWKAKGK